MSEDAPRKRRDDLSPSHAPTVTRKAYSQTDFDTMPPVNGPAGEVSPARTGGPRAHARGGRPERAPASSESPSRSTLVFVLGLVVVLGLGGLLVYLISVILRG